MKSLITARELNEAQLKKILKLSFQLKKNPESEREALKGKTVLQFFTENSTRTKISFETAVRKMGGTNIGFAATSSSLSKGESLLHTVQAIQQYGVDAMVMRHSSGGAIEWISKALNMPVINAGDGQHEHPTQALIDAFTLAEEWKLNLEQDRPFQSKKILMVGDILHSRVARSNIHALTKLGAEVTLIGPKTLIPRDLSLFPKLQVVYRWDHDEGKKILASADAVMMLRVQLERQKSSFFPSLSEYRHFWGMTEERTRLMKPAAVILHPGPVNQGVEIDSAVTDSSRSLILKQIENGVWVRMAVLKEVLACNS
jgi:aspartate carbamoyltransferase catalytic subunit